MKAFLFNEEPDQEFSSIISGRRCTFRFEYIVQIARWHFRLSIDDEPRLVGRRVVTGVDLIQPFGFGIGRLFAYSPSQNIEPDYDALISGMVKIYHATETEVAEALEAA